MASTAQLISILKRRDWVKAKEIAVLMATSERNVRNYIRRVNDSKEYKVISSREGYHLEPRERSLIENTPSADRVNQVIYTLLKSERGVSAFELADSLYISESTLSNDINAQVKPLVKKYNLHVQNNNYILHLSGAERDKRKLIGYLASHDSAGFFSSIETLKTMAPHVDLQALSDILSDYLNQADLSINDFSKHNLLLHLLIIFIRISNNNHVSSLPGVQEVTSILPGESTRAKITGLASTIADFFQSACQQSISSAEYRQIVILLSLSIDKMPPESDDFKQASRFIDRKFLQNIVLILNQISAMYDLPLFDSEFAYQFSMHMYNLYQRALFDVSYPNPLVKQIKKEHAPVYDMAVFCSQKFSEIYDVKVSEDEITFIAFHLGSNIEFQAKSNRLSCLVVSDNYHELSLLMQRNLERHFGADLSIIRVLSSDEFLRLSGASRNKADIVISSMRLPVEITNLIVIDPIMTAADFQAIRQRINDINQLRMSQSAVSYIHRFFPRSLFFTRVRGESERDYIRWLGNQCKQQGYVGDEFIEDVIEREKFSSTAFTDYVAIPHSITQHAEKTFVSVVHCEKPIQWGSKRVNFIFMIGVADGEMKYFRPVFELIINAFSSLEDTARLIASKNYKDFISILQKELG